MVYYALMKLTERKYARVKNKIKHENLKFDSRHEILIVV